LLVAVVQVVRMVLVLELLVVLLVVVVLEVHMMLLLLMVEVKDGMELVLEEEEFLHLHPLVQLIMLVQHHQDLDLIRVLDLEFLVDME
tara:strand:+ start:190 stop:453 length:264 start_codon:yes stop_codon:yes gene_type:complete